MVNLKKPSAFSLVLPALHLVLCIGIQLGFTSSEGSWRGFLAFWVDFPFSIALLPLLNVAPPLPVFGTLGTAWWYLIGRFVGCCFGLKKRFH